MNYPHWYPWNYDFGNCNLTWFYIHANTYCFTLCILTPSCCWGTVWKENSVMLEKLSLYYTVKKPGDTHDFKDCVITGVNDKEKLLFNFNFFNFKS